MSESLRTALRPSEARRLQLEQDVAVLRATATALADGAERLRTTLASLSPEITDVRADENRRRASEAEFRAMFEQSAVGMVQVSAATGKFVWVNTGFCAIVHYSAEELSEMTPADLTVADDRDDEVNAFGPLIRGEVASYDQEKRYLRKDGTIAWVHARAALLRDTEGRPERIIAVIQGITDRKAAEADRTQQLEQAEGDRVRLADVFRHAPAFMCVLRGPDHVFELANDRYVQLVGRRAVLGRPVRDALPEVVGQGFVALLDQVFATGQTSIGPSVPVILAREPEQPHEARYLDFVYDALRDPSGTVTGIVVVGVDMTERNRAETEVRSSVIKYRTLFDSIDQGYCVIELMFDDSGVAVDYRFMEVNPAFGKHTGMVGALGRTMREFVPDLETEWVERYGRVAQTGEPVRFIDEAKAMERRWFDVYAFRLGVAGATRSPSCSATFLPGSGPGSRCARASSATARRRSP